MFLQVIFYMKQKW